METLGPLDFNVLAYLHHIETVTNLASADDKMVIFLDCEGCDLGWVDGQLGLIQLGIEIEIYLIDVIALPKAITIVAMYALNYRAVIYIKVQLNPALR